MNSLALVIKLIPVDWRNIRRDSLLVWVPLLPLLLALLLRFGVPPFTEFLRSSADFDLEPWYPLIMGSFVISLPATIGTVIGFLLLDERDDGVLQALLVTPLSAPVYIGYRAAIPLLVGTVVTIVCYPLCGLVPLPWLDVAAASLLGGFSGPFMALYLVCFADNKVTGLAMMKLMNAFQLLPLIAYFVPMSAQLLFGLAPTYWPMKIVWLAAAGEPYGGFFVAGLGVNLVAVGLLMRRFDRIIHR